MEHRRSVGRERLDGGLVQRAGAHAAAEDDHDRALGGQPESLAGLRRVGRDRARRDRPADDAVLRRRRGRRSGTRGTRACANGAAQRFASPRCASASVSATGIRKQPRRRDHRPGHVATATEHDVGANAPEDLQAGRERGGIHGDGVGEREIRSPRQTLDPELLERIPGGRDELGLSSLRAGEPDARAAPAQRVGHGEAGQHVSCRPSGCDQALDRSLRRHRWRRC